MLFNSIDYFVFFLFCYAIYWLAPGKIRKYILICFSLLFYGYWSISFLFHFLSIIVVTHLFVQAILKTKKKVFLAIGIILNLLNLCFFKYILTYLQYLTKEGDISISWVQSLSEFALPLAISFYTFQMIAYLVDAWRGKFQESPFLNFLLFIMFFPQLIAGPIMRHDDFYGQIQNSRLNWDYVQRGILHLLSGIIKKVLIADQIARIINPVWQQPELYDGFSIFLAVVGFSVQVYSDFSGYTDLARGSAFLLGYEIPENFHSPFLSVSFSELWTRWHITLSTWIRDYMYIPLGGNRVNQTRFIINTLIVMSLGGLWHGNTYTYFLWGLTHGIWLSLERFFIGKCDRSQMNNFRKVVGFIYVFIGWQIATIFFRAENFEKIIKYVSAFSNLKGNIIYKADFWTLVISCYLIQWIEFKKYFSEQLKSYSFYLIPALSAIVYFAMVKIENPIETFIYFQF